MKTKEIEQTYTRIREAIEDGALKPAFDLLQSLIMGTALHAFQQTLDGLQETYRYLLRYYAEGAKDPMQEQIYDNIRIGVCELADRLKHEALTVASNAAYYAEKRTLAIAPTDPLILPDQLRTAYDLDNVSRYEEAVDRLFSAIWTTAFLNEKEVATLRTALHDDSFPIAAKCQIVSALLLGLQTSFDVEKLTLLFDAAGLTNDEVRVRAYVGICLTLYKHRMQAALYPTVRFRTDALAEQPDFERMMLTVALRFIHARETEKITHRMQEEIIPEMIKMMPKMHPGNRRIDFTADPADNDLNPEWPELFADSKLSKSIEAYNRLQEEGADVMHSAFIHLKHFSFFRNVSNWFLPFSTKHSALKQANQPFAQALDTVLQSSSICNSDKYSLFLSLLQIPEMQRQAMMTQISQQLDEMNRISADQRLKSHQRSIEEIAAQYVQDLYRFYKLHPGRADFADPFDRPLDFHNLILLRPHLSNEQWLLNVADFYLYKEFFEQALGIYEQLVSRSAGLVPVEQLYQKMGHCRQMIGDTREALADYLRSEMIEPDSKWLLRRIATCYRQLKQYDRALHYYLRCERLNPDSLPLLFSIGHCYMELHEYGEALKYYFKADYLDSDNLKAWRAIGWCSFLSGKYDQARSYYRKLLDRDPQPADCLNAAHTEWVLQQVKTAVDLYRQALAAVGHDFDTFYRHFEPDIAYLQQAGVSQTDIALMLDRLRYGDEG